MNTQVTSSQSLAAGLDTTPLELVALVEQGRNGATVDGMSFLDPTDGRVQLPEQAANSRIILIENDIVLILPDGSVIVLLDGVTNAYPVDFGADTLSSALIAVIATPETVWRPIAELPDSTLQSLPQINLTAFAEDLANDVLGGGEALPVLAGDPLKGLGISPLQLFTDYPDVPPEDDFEGVLNPPSEALPQITLIAPAETNETDAPVDITLSDYAALSLVGKSIREFIDVVEVSVPGLPVGTVASGGVLTTAADGTLTLTFSGSESDYLGLTITFPTDFSTESRNDRAEGDLTVTVTATTNFGDTVTAEFPITIAPEGDVEIDDTLPDNVPDETDAPTPLVPADLLLPAATDEDDSEIIEQLILTIEGLPGDGSFTLANVSGIPTGATFALETAPDGSSTLTITMLAASVGDVEAAYAGLALELPVDFSTANRTDLDPLNPDGPTTRPIKLTLDVHTDEDQDLSVDLPNDGQAVVSREVEIGFEADIEIVAQELIEVDEDDGIGGDPSPGVDVPLPIDITVSDIDGSETEDPSDPRFATNVTIVFDDLPTGALLNGAVVPGGVWTGTVAQAESLSLYLPGDYSGTVVANITATSPEGSVTAVQTIRVRPTGDVEIEVEELLSAETDDVVYVRPADAWKVSVSDDDGAVPPETLTDITVTLADLPAAMDIRGVPSSSYSYDPVAGGAFSFTGTEAEYAALELGFPKDFSTESPAADGLVLEGTISANSTEGSGGPVDVVLRITPEGDVEIDDTLPDNVPDETDAPTPLVPADLLLPAATDDDGSESLETLELRITGLPGSGFDLGNISGLPAGTGTLTTEADGSTSLAVMLDGATHDIATVYAALALELPTDFSTANRNDLDPVETSGATSMPITLTLTVITDEEQDPANDIPGDGQETAVRVVEIGVEGDIAVTGTGVIELEENDPVGVIDEDDTTTDPLDFALKDVLVATATDADGSETVVRAVVSINGLPDGTLYSIDGGTNFVAVPATPAFTETFTYAGYGDLVFRLPADYSTDSVAPDFRITGSVTFATDEAIMAGETDMPADPTNGIETAKFTVKVADETDVTITAVDYEGNEDVPPHPLNLDAAAVDIDGSEEIIGITVSFTDLPTNTDAYGPIVLESDRNSYTIERTDTFTITVADATELQSLVFTSFPTHYSGIVNAVVNVQTDEGDPAGTDKAFEIRIRPDAEPELDIAIVVENGVEETGVAQYLIKEDNGFTLRIAARTPDDDGSESLKTLVVDYVPSGWVLTNPDGSVDLSQFSGETGKIAGATLAAGTDYDTLTITLADGTTGVDLDLRMTLLDDDDRDHETITGIDAISVEVLGVDTAAGLTDDTDSVTKTLDVNVDAVIDPLDINAVNRSSNENTRIRRIVDAGFKVFGLMDTDGSEVVEKVTLTISVETESDDFSLSRPNDFSVQVGRFFLRDAADINLVATGPDSVTYEVTPTAGTTGDDFAVAIESLRYIFPKHFSGAVTTNGSVEWSETTTPTTFPGDVEVDLSDNLATDTFQTIIEVKPVAEAELRLRVFTRDDDITDNDLDPDSPEFISGVAIDGANVSIAEILTLRESTRDGTGPGTAPSIVLDDAGNPILGPNGQPQYDDQVEVYFGLDASTPDTDGSEELETLVVDNIPTDWIPDAWAGLATIPASEWDQLTTLDGSAPLSGSELAKIESIEFVAATGTLTITFKDDVTSFQAALPLTPTTYEDWDPDQTAPFDVVRPSGSGTSADLFHGNDITVEIETRDENTVRQDTETATIEANVDVSPINNTAYIVSQSTGNEAVIDNLPGGPSGIWDFQLVLDRVDIDASEQITAVVFREFNPGISVYVNSIPSIPSSPYEIALITAVYPDGSVDWSLENGTWENLQFRNVPLHLAGVFPVEIDVVTTEFDGGGTRVTTIDTFIGIAPVADGGTPSGNVDVNEDASKAISISANIIDSFALASGRPFDDSFEFFNQFRLVDGDFPKDGFGRPYLIFDGAPQIDPASPPDPTDPFNTSGYLNLIDPTAWLPASLATNLHILPGLDSNEDIGFQIEVEYVENIAPSEKTTGIGTVSVDVKGIADTPEVDGQEEDPELTPGGIPISDIALIDPIYRADSDDTDGAGGVDPSGELNFHRLYGYAGDDSRPFQLTQRLTDSALLNGFANVDPANVFEAATDLSGTMTETTAISGGSPFDGSETIYYLITGIPAGTTFLGSTPITSTGDAVLVTRTQLANLAFVPKDVSEVTYYDLQFSAIVLEDDVDVASFERIRDSFRDPVTGDIIDFDGLLAKIEELPGAAVESEDFSIVVLPDPVGGGGECPTEELLPPEIAIIGSGLEDEVTEIELVLTPNSQYSDILDLLDLPAVGSPPIDVSGDLGILLTIPPGSSLSSNPPGAVLFDPISGGWAIDLAILLAGNSDGDTVSAGKILYTPPAHESSPVNPFDFDDTFGPDDPYDNLPNIEVSLILNNVTCGTTTTGTGTSNVVIDPVVDGPTISVALTSLAPSGVYPFPVPEDEPIALDITISSLDEGEQLAPGSEIIVTINGSHIGGPLSDLDRELGLQQSGLYDGSGNIIDDGRLQIIGGNYVYTLSPDDIAGLTIIPKNHIHGELSVSVEATSQDIDLTTKSGTGTARIEIDAIADDALVNVDETILDPETGLPVASIDDNGTPDDPTDDVIVLTHIEDVQNFSGLVVQSFSPDMDGSEFVSAVVTVPDYIELGTSGVGGGLIDNGDGTYTIAAEDFDTVWYKLKDEHARTPDNLDPSLPDEVPFSVKLIVYELSNGDESERVVNYRVRIRPDADKPTATGSITPVAGDEDQLATYEIDISGQTPDFHEEMEFEISGLPAGSTILLNGTALAETAPGVVVVPTATGLANPDGLTFFPSGTVEFVPPADFAGTVDLQVTSITTDDVPAPWDSDGYVDRERSDPVDLTLVIEPTPDLTVTASATDVVLAEDDIDLEYIPGGAFTIDVSDTDGSELVETVDYTLSGMPAGLTYSYRIGTGTPVTLSGDLSLPGLSAADFGDLVVIFPADFSTAGVASLTSSIRVTTNEFGDETASHTLAIDAEEDLVLSVDNADVDLVEDTTALGYKPTDDITINVTDADGSEVATVTYTLNGVPNGMQYSIDGVVTDVPDGAPLTFTGSAADFDKLTLRFPADYASNGAPLNGTIAATTNEGGSENGTFALEVSGTLDLTVTVTPNPAAAPESAAEQVLNIGIDTSLPASAAAYETPEEAVVSFADAVPAGVVASDGTWDAGRRTLTLNRSTMAMDVATFVAAVEALSLTVPANFVGAFDGEVAIETNHGTTTEEDFAITVGPVTAPLSAPTTFAAPAFSSFAFASDEPLDAAAIADPAPEETVQMVTAGETRAEDGEPRERMADVTGSDDKRTIAKGSEENEAVLRDDDQSFESVEVFQLLGGDDLVDLRGASEAVSLDLGAGNDIAYGGSGDDLLEGGLGDDILAGGAGADTLTGGEGSDSFLLAPEPGIADVITDYQGPEAGGDTIDLTAFGLGVEVAYNNTSGELSVQDEVVADVSGFGGGIPEAVEVIFETAAGQATVMV